jgi:hypothetical protein
VRAAERRVDGAGLAVGRAPDKREIGAFQIAGAAMIGKLGAEVAMGEVVLGHDHDAAGFLVETVHDARTFDTADTGQRIAAMVDQRIDQRAGPVAVAGMYHETRRLVDDDQVGILVENVECNIFSRRRCVFRFGDFNGDADAFAQLVFRLAHDLAVDADLPVADERLDAVAGQIRCQLRREPCVKSLARCLVIGN